MVDFDAVARLVVAAALGAAVGFEREATDQPAGLRTHIAVALGASLFGVVSTLGFEEFFARRETTNVQVDVTRVASQVVVGIGFIGAGMIFRQGGEVRNLTTAASLWVTSAIGLAAGVGELVTATVATAAVLVSLALLRPIRDVIRGSVAYNRRMVRIILRPDADPGGLIAAMHDLDGVEVSNLNVDKERGAFAVVADVRSRPHVPLSDRLAEISRRDDVESLGDR